jgi:hypothetical protein
MSNNIVNITKENKTHLIWQTHSAILQINSIHSDTIRQKPSGIFQSFILSRSHYHNSEYSLYLPDKKLLQRKLKEWMYEFENINDKLAIRNSITNIQRHVKI